MLSNCYEFVASVRTNDRFAHNSEKRTMLLKQNDTSRAIASVLVDRIICLQVLDLSYGAIESIDGELFKYYPNLRVLDLSRNALGTTGNTLEGTFTHLTLIREVWKMCRLVIFKR